MAERYFLRKASDGSWIIKEEFLTTKAKEWAKKFAEEGLKRSQLRRFYNEVRSLADRVKDDTSFQRILPLIRMLKPKGGLSKGRKLVPNSFVDFIDTCVDEKFG
ncbi:MAG: type III-A CRISPR-associated protein Csm2 [Candidatus Kryptonium sp.]